MNPKGRVAIVFPFGNLDSVPSLQSAAMLLANHGYLVDIFTEYDNKHLKPHVQDQRISVFPLRTGSRKTLSGLSHYLMGTVGLPVRLSIRHASVPYRCIIGVDPTGLVTASEMARQLDVPLAYYSLELLLSYEITTEQQRRLKLREQALSRLSAFVIIQDDERASLLRRDNDLSPEQVICVPNAPLGEARIQRSDFLRRKFELSESAIIILHTGSLGDWTAARQLMSSTWDWPPDWKLVCHTRYKETEAFKEYLETLKKLSNPKQVLFSTAPLGYNEYPMLVQSADVGVVFYWPQEDSSSVYTRDNIRYIGLSSGKLAYQLQCGIPVLVNDIPSLRRLSTVYGCGEATVDPSSTQLGIKRILSDYQTYSENAIRCFREEFDFEERFRHVLAAINDLHEQRGMAR